MPLVQVVERTGEPLGGCSNTQLRAKNGTAGIAAVEHGVDTWTLIRHLDSDSDLERAYARFEQVPGRFLELRSGHRVGFLPRHRMLRIEGHPAVEGLAVPAMLDRARDSVLAELDSQGLPPGVEGGLSRIDVTSTVRFEKPEAGLAFLEGLAHLEVNRMGKSVVYRAKGRRPESVIWKGRGGRRTLARAYDKGVEAGTAEPGRLIRLESQNRFQKQARFSVETIKEHPDLTRSMYVGRFAPLASAAEGITAASVPVLVEKVRDQLARGEIKAGKAARLIGFLLLGYEHLPRRTRYRWQREAREAGLVLADPLNDPVEVDLGEGLEAALAAWSRDA